MKLEAARRLTAALNSESPLSTIVEDLTDHGIKSDYPDDNKNSIVVQADLISVVKVLQSAKWAVDAKYPTVGGMYTSGTCVSLTNTKLGSIKVYNTSPNRVTIWVA